MIRLIHHHLPVIALTLSAAALMFAGGMILGYGSTTLGRCTMAMGGVFFVAAAMMDFPAVQREREENAE